MGPSCNAKELHGIDAPGTEMQWNRLDTLRSEMQWNCGAEHCAGIDLRSTEEQLN